MDDTDINDDIYEKRVANESIGQYWNYFGYAKVPIDDDEDDQTNKNKTVQPRSNPRNNQGGRFQTRYKPIRTIPKGRKNQFEVLQFIRHNPLFKKK